MKSVGHTNALKCLGFKHWLLFFLMRIQSVNSFMGTQPPPGESSSNHCADAGLLKVSAMTQLPSLLPICLERVPVSLLRSRLCRLHRILTVLTLAA